MAALALESVDTTGRGDGHPRSEMGWECPVAVEESGVRDVAYGSQENIESIPKDVYLAETDVDSRRTKLKEA